MCSSMGVSWKKEAQSSRTRSRQRATRDTGRLQPDDTNRDRRRQGDPRGVPVRFLQPRRGEGLLLQVGAWAEPRDRRGDLGAQEGAGVDAQVPAQVARLLLCAPAADMGRRPDADRLREHLLLHQADREAGELVGRAARGDQGHVGQARHPGGGEEVPRRRWRAVRVGGRLPQAPGGAHQAGRALPRHGLRSARARGAGQAVLRHDHPAERQQVRGAQLRRLVGRQLHLRAAGREDRDAAAGLLPHQRGEHGPVRAHADPRRRGRLRPLRRGCTAPVYSSDSLHSAVVEIVVKKDARCRYTTIQNWSNNVYNLVTKRAVAYEGATMEWIDGNLGSKVTMKYPAVYLMEPRAHGEVLSIAFAGKGQHQDAGAKMVHAAPHTSSTIISKSIARGGGRTSYRGLVQVLEGSHHSRST